MATDKQKSFFYLTPAALEVIDRRAESPNKRGEWISAALIDYDQILNGVTGATDDAGTLEQIVSRLAALERMVSLLITRTQAQKANEDHE